MAGWLLPVPELPTSSRFSRLSMYSPRASSLTSSLLTDGWALSSPSASAPNEVERVERLVRREPGRLQSPVGRTTLAIDQFQFAQLQQEAEMIDILGGTATGDFGAFAEHRRQLERLEVMLQQDRAPGFGLAHAPPPIKIW